MEGTVRLLLLSMLAIAVSARYEFNRRTVENIKAGIRGLGASREIEHTNMHVDVEWIASREDYDGLEIVFDIISPVAYGEDCGGGPTITIDKGPKHCLYSVSFLVDTDNNDNDILTVSLYFRHNSVAQDRVVVSDVFKPPVNKEDDIWNTLQLQPFNLNQLERAQRGHSFTGPVSWVGNILDKGVYAEQNSRDGNSEPQADTDDTMDVINYTTHPVTIDANIVEAIVDLNTPSSPQ